MIQQLTVLVPVWIMILVFALSAWAIVAEIRIRKLQGKLIVSQEGKIDADIVLKNHALSDADLDAKLSAFIGGNKPAP